jgi:beta-lactamase class A
MCAQNHHLKICFIVSVLLTLITSCVYAQLDSLRLNIAAIAKSINGHVGVAMIHLEYRDTLTFNGKDHFPMQSVYKFPLALAVLHQVDIGKLKLQQKIHITKEELLPNTWSPLRDKYQGGNVDLPLSEIIATTVSQSDNNGCDILFRLVGGPKEVEKYIHDLGVRGIAIAATEEEMHKSWDVQYTNWAVPMAISELFNLFYKKDILLKASKDFLWKVLVETTTGSKRIKGQLPPHIIVGHKTGTGGKNEQGIVGAINDAGIIILPNGETVALTVFISDTSEPENNVTPVIAKIARAVYNFYNKP